MYKSILWGLLAIVFVGLASCSKKDPVIGSVNTNELTVTIDGRSKSFSDVEARWIDGGHFLEINATDDGSEWITITVLSDVRRVPAGTYHLDDASEFKLLSNYSIISDMGQLNYTATDDTFAPEDAFTLHLDKIDNGSAQGTFSGTLVRVSGEATLGTVGLADGRFKVSIKPN